MANKVKHFEVISKGGLTHTIADPRIIFQKALEVQATSMVLCHNHPSGNLKPSRADEELTAKLKSAGTLLDIRVVDHLIVSDEGYYSFADEGMI
jgi:DNA repair protein RadC